MAWYQRHNVESVCISREPERDIPAVKALREALDLSFTNMYQLCILNEVWVLFVCYYIVIFDEKMKLAGYDLRKRTKKIKSSFTMAY